MARRAAGRGPRDGVHERGRRKTTRERRKGGERRAKDGRDTEAESNDRGRADSRAARHAEHVRLREGVAQKRLERDARSRESGPRHGREDRRRQADFEQNCARVPPPGERIGQRHAIAPEQYREHDGDHAGNPISVARKGFDHFA